MRLVSPCMPLLPSADPKRHNFVSHSTLGAVAAMADDAPKKDELKRKKSYAPKGHVDGLAVAWANREECRAQILQGRTLLKWPDAQRTGICSQRALKLNKSVMLSVASILCPQSKHKLGLNVGPLKKQARHFVAIANIGSGFFD